MWTKSCSAGSLLLILWSLVTALQRSMTIGRGHDMRQYDTQSASALSYVVTNSRVGSQNLVILLSLWSEKAPESALGDTITASWGVGILPKHESYVVGIKKSGQKKWTRDPVSTSTCTTQRTTMCRKNPRSQGTKKLSLQYSPESK